MSVVTSNAFILISYIKNLNMYEERQVALSFRNKQRSDLLLRLGKNTNGISLSSMIKAISAAIAFDGF